MYERAFGTDWETIDDLDEVVRRAYALGVSARLGADHPEELTRLGEQLETTYDRSLVTLAYQRGRNDAHAADDATDVWEAVVDDAISIRPPADTADAAFEPADDADGAPDALRRVDIDTLPDDTTAAIARPSFLDPPGWIGGRGERDDGADRDGTDRDGTDRDDAEN